MGLSVNKDTICTLVGKETLRSQAMKYDAIVVGSGPNGLSAAITLQREGLRVLLLEAKQTIGGGMRTAELTQPGFLHDVCSAVHPMAAASPFFRTLPLHEFGLQYIIPEVLAAHPFDDGTAAALHRSIAETTASLGVDGPAYRRLFEPLVDAWPLIEGHILGPMLKWPKNPLELSGFGLKLLQSGKQVASRFQTKQLRGLWSGIVAHSMIPLDALTSSAIGFVLTIAGHRGGWPIPVGGSQRIADALAGYFQALGGTIHTDSPVTALSQLPESKAVLFDTSPKQLL